MEQTNDLRMNVSVTDSGAILYNFGVKRAVPNCMDLLNDSIWKDKLLNKWVYMKDAERGKNIFMKHIFNGKRVMQAIYSGEDIYGDGLYKIYSAKIIYKPGTTDFIIDPVKFSLIYGAFDFHGNGLLDKLIAEGYISEKEKDILSDEAKADEFAQSLYYMPEHF